jgi:anti-sigma B factor antagonist
MGETDDTDPTLQIVGETEKADYVIKLHGDIDLRALPRLRGALSYALFGRPDRLIIDLAEVTSVDAAGLAILAAARYRGRDIGTPLLLQAPNASTVELLAATGLDQVLPIVHASGEANVRLSAPPVRQRRRPLRSK